MTVRQVVFLLTFLVTIGVFSYSMMRLWSFFQLTRPHEISHLGQRAVQMLKVAFAQTKIFRWPFSGILHALLFWGFLVITLGSLEMVVDGIFGLERSFGALGSLYNFIIGSGEVFALIIIFAVIIFVIRRISGKVKRLKGQELHIKSSIDAQIALLMIFLLMVSLLGMNIGYLGIEGAHARGAFPVSRFLAGGFIDELRPQSAFTFHEVNWWAHILLIFIFANVLPYSKHFHVFTSIPNVYLSSIKNPGYLSNMKDVEIEVRLMMDPAAKIPETEQAPAARFGVKDVEDVTWKNYLDSLACTECGRCTAVCPANITGKKLSPRKIFVDLRARMKEKGPLMVKEGKDHQDEKSLVGSYVTPEELWACTTCCACAKECPVNINHPLLIVDMRRYLVMEEGKAPASLNAMFTNIENNGAPWQYSAQDRLNWTQGPRI